MRRERSSAVRSIDSSDDPFPIARGVLLRAGPEGKDPPKATLLLADADSRPTGKVKKAREYGIEIRSKESFEAEFYIEQ